MSIKVLRDSRVKLNKRIKYYCLEMLSKGSLKCYTSVLGGNKEDKVCYKLMYKK